MAKGPWQTALVTYGIAACGAGVTYLLGFPAPFLTGPAIAVTVAGLAGMRTAALPHKGRNAVFVLLGLTIGQGVTPEVFDAMRAWPVTLAALAASLFAIIFVTRAALVRLWSMDPVTAFLSSSPGHLSYVLGLTEGVSADLKTVSIVQSIRVLALTLLVPVAVALAGQIPEQTLTPPPVTPVWPLLAMIVAGGAAGFGLARLRLPAAYLLGGMFVSLAAHGSGLVSGVMWPWLAAAAFVSLGALIGSRFSGVTWPDLRRAFSAGLMVTLVAVVFAGVFGAIAHWFTGMDLLAILIAFAPGGLETMAALAVVLAIDPTFVASHHVARLLMLTVVVPVFLIGSRRNRP
ncbi:AbrB family transcriptional regulator [Hoeflea olei]|uniref:Ammonia monooxygenase n=1 Tax=Hoeflea olei TaxID=1480615 RepID=A0A1C1Z0K9_9HYPH|nr:AbrB family transcriptional regulator [Hoeflea olei]OCW59220.1 hypothetical protein AWJ14_09170 [Hoeflea olei]